MHWADEATDEGLTRSRHSSFGLRALKAEAHTQTLDLG